MKPQTSNTTMKMLNDLDDMWGDARIAFALTTAVLEDRWVTMRELEDQTRLSHETVRRHLKPLIRVGRVAMEKEGNRHYYQAAPEWADRVCLSVREFCERFPYHHENRAKD